MAGSYSIYETKTRLSELLRHVKSGRECVVTERGKPVAKLVPYHTHVSLAGRLDVLRTAGGLIARKRRGCAGSRKVRGGLRRFLQERE